MAQPDVKRRRIPVFGWVLPDDGREMSQRTLGTFWS